MDTLSETLQRLLAGYAGDMLNGYSYLTTNADRTVFAIIGLGYIGDRHFVDTSLIARLARNTVVIEHDVNNKPLIEALLAVGIPRNQIILAYAGESTDAAA
jgi:XisI protein